MSPFDIGRDLGAALRLLGDTGLTGTALAGIMAAWDALALALALAAGMPLARLLGDSLRPVPSYFSQAKEWMGQAWLGTRRGVLEARL